MELIYSAGLWTPEVKFPREPGLVPAHGSFFGSETTLGLRRVSSGLQRTHMTHGVDTNTAILNQKAQPF
jgi:hypothetical protein